MKGFFICAALLAIVAIVAITQSDNLSQFYYTKILISEGGVEGLDAFQKLRDNSPNDFKDKYQDSFQDRIYLGKYAYIFGGDRFYMDLAADTQNRYLGSPFDGNEDFAQMLSRYGHVVDQHNNSTLALSIYNGVAEHFPNYSGMNDVQNAIRLLKIRTNSFLPSRFQKPGPMLASLRGGCMTLLLFQGLMAAPSLQAAGDNEVSLDEAAPSPSPTVTRTFTTAPTPVPTNTSVAETPTPVSASTPAGEDNKDAKDDLSNPNFDKSGSPAGAPQMATDTNEDNGLVIIAPGAASPEDSLEAFGIDTPFNWREKKRQEALTQPNASDENIELNPPETSDLSGGQPVAVEEPGKPASQAEDYDAVERAGSIVPEADYQFDGTVIRQKDGRLNFVRGDIVYLQMNPGRQVYPGSIYSVFRDEGKVEYGEEGLDLGHLIHAVSVLRVIRVDSENIMARVEKQYDTGRIGDGVRLRDPDRAKHYASLRESTGQAPSADINGQVVALENGAAQVEQGDHVYLSVGREQGVQPGMKLLVYRAVPDEKDPEEVQPGPVGKIGELVVVSTQKESCTALLVKAETGLRVNDLVRYR